MPALPHSNTNLVDSYRHYQAQKKLPLPQQLGDKVGLLFVAISGVIMAFSSFFEIFPILIFYSLWFPQIILKGLSVLRPTKEMAYALLIPIFACLSVLWSDYPHVTLHMALECLSMVLATIIMARLVPVQSFMKGIALGMTMIMVITLMNGQYARDELTGTYALVGYFASHNLVGFMGEVGMLAGMLLLFTRIRWWEKMIFGVISSSLCLGCIFLSHSATSIASLAAALAMIGLAYGITRFPLRYRFIGATIIGMLTAMIIIAGVILDMHEIVLHNLGKDSTLTGRTYLWSEGYKIGWEKPVLGHGYCAFWVQGQPQAERYWYEYLITGRSGFHFHNLFVQSFVDLGAVGFFFMVLLILLNCIKSLKAILLHGMKPELAFLLAIAFMFLIRAFVEVDFLGPFGVGMLLFYCIPTLVSSFVKQLTAA